MLFAKRAAHRHGSTQWLHITEGVITQICGNTNLSLAPPVVGEKGRYTDQGYCGPTVKRKRS